MQFDITGPTKNGRADSCARQEIHGIFIAQG